MKILHILPSNSFSGAENVACQIIEMFKEDNNYEMVYCSPDGEIRKILAARKIPYVMIQHMSVFQLKSVVDAQKPNIIHVHDMKASVLVSIVCGRIPIISHIHNNDINNRSVNIKSFLYCLAARKAKHIIWVSKSAYTGYYYHKKFEGKSTVLYNVINRSALISKLNDDLNEYKYDIVYIGRLCEQKDPLRLLSVLEAIVKNNNSVKIAIIGRGLMEEELIRKTEKLGLQKNITFLGYQMNPYKLMSNAKVMLMTSRWEGTPMCALEAIALGLPIVSTPTDGLCEIVMNDVTGYLSDNNEELAEKCCAILENRELYDKYHLATMEYANKLLNVKKYKKILDDIYNLYK